MDHLEKLKNMLTAHIAGNETEATSELHDYIVAKMKEIGGFPTAQQGDEELNQLPDLHRHHRHDEITSFDDEVGEI